MKERERYYKSILIENTFLYLFISFRASSRSFKEDLLVLDFKYKYIIDLRELFRAQQTCFSSSLSIHFVEIQLSGGIFFSLSPFQYLISHNYYNLSLVSDPFFVVVCKTIYWSFYIQLLKDQKRFSFFFNLFRVYI